MRGYGFNEVFLPHWVGSEPGPRSSEEFLSFPQGFNNIHFLPVSFSQSFLPFIHFQALQPHKTSRENVSAWLARAGNYCHFSLLQPEEVFTGPVTCGQLHTGPSSTIPREVSVPTQKSQALYFDWHWERNMRISTTQYLQLTPLQHPIGAVKAGEPPQPPRKVISDLDVCVYLNFGCNTPAVV